MENNQINKNNSSAEIETINRILLAVNASQTVDQLCTLAGEQIHKVIPFERASIAICDESEERLRVFGLYGSGVAPLMIGAEGQLKGSVSEYALTQREIIIVSESDFDKKHAIHYDDIAREGFQSALCVPLYSGEKKLGSLNLTSRKQNAYNEYHVELLESLRLPLSLAVEKAILLDQKERRTKELEGLFSISNSFSTLKDLSEIFSELPRKIAELIGGESALITTYDKQSNLMKGEMPGFNFSAEFVGEFRYKLKEADKAKYVFELGNPFYSNDAQNDTTLNPDFIQKHGVRSIIGAPMYIKGELIGFIYVVNRIGGFTRNDVRLLGIFAHQVAETITNVKLVNELKEVNKMKDVFLATISHELRTPLMAIKGWAEILAANPTLQNDEEGSEGLNVIQNSTLSLTNLISDLLDMSRLQRHKLKLNLQQSDLNNIIAESIQAVRYQAQDKEIELLKDLYEQMPDIKVDKQRIQQVLWNLLTNAIKFTQRNGQITVRSRLLNRDEDIVLYDDESTEKLIAVEIQDTGEGIPEDFLPYIWEKFHQAETEQKKSGLGIGLSLVKELTEAHGGHVTVKSNNNGTTFTIYLPVSEYKQIK